MQDKRGTRYCAPEKNHHAKNSRKPKKRRDTGALLIEQLSALAGAGHNIKMIRERRWASISFSGVRHKILISRQPTSVAQDMSRSLAATITDHIFDLPGHFVADIVVDDRPEQDHSIIVEILTIIDPVAS
ncbi:hypothetical protein AB1K62_13180 [Parasphingorhabdus sp. JC815]|uniref:hypothetical protein n=1 Tax=Parasphingorhabdus sp. JC815 TaxID=3232140 RepID=UPI003458481D